MMRSRLPPNYALALVLQRVETIDLLVQADRRRLDHIAPTRLPRDAQSAQEGQGEGQGSRRESTGGNTVGPLLTPPLLHHSNCV